jgi:hypothetical protein
MQAPSSSPVMMDAKVFVDIRRSGSGRHRNDGRSLPGLDPKRACARKASSGEEEAVRA